MLDLNEVIEVYDFNHCISRDGFIFTPVGDSANIFDGIVIRNPENCDCWSPKKSFSDKTLKEHIDFINENKIEKAFITADDLSFLELCPSLKYLWIVPSKSTPDNFSYAPLYKMPEIKYLSCETTYKGISSKLSTSIDYSQIKGLKVLNAVGEGHLNYEKNEGLELLFVSEEKTHEDLLWLSDCKNLKKLDFVKTKLKSLEGISALHNLQCLSLSYCHSLVNISELPKISTSLRSLCIEVCPKIKDFSFLSSLKNLEHLELIGGNSLPDLSFLSNMYNLKTFTFSMDVLNNDLNPCLNVPYVNLIKGKKEYNLKDKDLPKQRPTKPFALI
ncbi:MAG: leucine-rich repeat domain-containing protein [Ruminococcaceae bacterium]|nr:leucine-rich repeat domain-containing protein [Oscillospiraceae bacterium]